MVYLWLLFFYRRHFGPSTFWPMLPKLSTLWPSTFWPSTFWPDTTLLPQLMTFRRCCIQKRKLSFCNHFSYDTLVIFIQDARCYLYKKHIDKINILQVFLLFNHEKKQCYICVTKAALYVLSDIFQMEN